MIRSSSCVEGAEPKEGHVTRSADGMARKVGGALSGESAELPHPQEHKGGAMRMEVTTSVP